MCLALHTTLPTKWNLKQTPVQMWWRDFCRTSMQIAGWTF